MAYPWTHKNQEHRRSINRDHIQERKILTQGNPTNQVIRTEKGSVFVNKKHSAVTNLTWFSFSPRFTPNTRSRLSAKKTKHKTGWKTKSNPSTELGTLAACEKKLDHWALTIQSHQGEMAACRNDSSPDWTSNWKQAAGSSDWDQELQRIRSSPNNLIKMQKLNGELIHSSPTCGSCGWMRLGQSKERKRRGSKRAW